MLKRTLRHEPRPLFASTSRTVIGSWTRPNVHQEGLKRFTGSDVLPRHSIWLTLAKAHAKRVALIAAIPPS